MSGASSTKDTAVEPIRWSIRVRCSVERAFDTFTAQIDLWWPPGHKRFDTSQLVFEPRLGGRLYERAQTGEENRLGDVLHWEPPFRVMYSWYPGSNVGPTTVDVRFRVDGDATVVDVAHLPGQSEFDRPWPIEAQKFVGAWNTVLGALHAFIERSNY